LRGAVVRILLDLSLAGRVFLVIATTACSAPQAETPSQLKFNSAEHLLLGDLGYQKACESLFLSCPEVLARADGKISFSYGELVALGGDFYADPNDIYFEESQPVKGVRKNRVEATKDLFQKELLVVEQFLHGHDEAEYPNFSTNFALNYPGYLHLAMTNVSHFGFYNAIRYTLHHQKALDIALEAYQLKEVDEEAAAALLEKAIFFNGFADHFLTDAFASGHIRTPRQQIMDWAKENKIRSTVADVIAKLLHDRDGEVRRSGEHGLLVRNSLGYRWLARCDSQLFWQQSLEDPGVTQVTDAVAASLAEILETYATGKQTEGIFAASWHLPFVDPAEKQLTEIFSTNLSESDYQAILSNASWYLQSKLLTGFDEDLFRKFLQDLPAIMQSFRQDVREQIAISPLLQQRLPENYLEAFTRVR